MGGDLDEAERMLAAEMIRPLIVANSSFSQTLTDQAKDRAAENVQPVEVDIAQGEVVVRDGTPPTAADLEAIQALGLGQDAPLDVTTLAGWFLLAVLAVTILLAWIWRFRPDALAPRQRPAADRTAVRRRLGRVEGDRRSRVLGYFLPTAAIGMVLTILLDASVATIVMALVAVMGGALAGSSLSSRPTSSSEVSRASWRIRAGDRLQTFVQAGIVVFVVNALVVSVFSLLGTRDIRGVLELWFASAASAAGSSVAAVGTFAVLGSAFSGS